MILDVITLLIVLIGGVIALFLIWKRRREIDSYFLSSKIRFKPNPEDFEAISNWARNLPLEETIRLLQAISGGRVNVILSVNSRECIIRAVLREDEDYLELMKRDSSIG